MQSTHKLLADRYLITHKVPSTDHKARLDQFLKNYYRTRSREKIKTDIESGIVTIDRQSNQSVGRLKPSSQVLEGDIIKIQTVRKPEPEVDFNYKKLFEDENFLIIDKPGNLPVHPAGKYFFHTLLTHLKTNGFTEPLNIEREYYLVHRIDRETSGLLLLCRNKEHCTHLVNQFKMREIQKKYYAIVHGSPVEDELTVRKALRRSKTSLIRLKMDVTDDNDPEGQVALTHFKVLERKNNFSLIACYPKTGRQHQIRVHLANAGYPIVGDKLYSLTDEEAFLFYKTNGMKRKQHKKDNQSVVRYISAEIMNRLILPRHALHAASLSFIQPAIYLSSHNEKKIDSGQTNSKKATLIEPEKILTFESELPQDLADFFYNSKKPFFESC